MKLINRVIPAGVALMLGISLTQPASTQTASLQPASECTASAPKAPVVVTGHCIDPRFKEPFIDLDEMRNTPVPHRYVHGGFKGTDAKFAFCCCGSPIMRSVVRRQWARRLSCATVSYQGALQQALRDVSWPTATSARTPPLTFNSTT
jgi:hypothetical protein